MADSNTPNFNFTQPEVGASKGSWGTKLNLNWELLDTILGGSGTTGTFLRREGGTMTGPIILPTANPTTDNQATRKAYVDAQIATRLTQAAADARYLQLSGGTMAGHINMGAFTVTSDVDPALNTQLSRKGYVDAGVNSALAAASARLPLAGGTMTGNINMGDGIVTSTAEPPVASALTRKAYVDAQVATRMTQAASDARYLNLTGGSMTGNIAMGANIIATTTNPVNNNDLTRKAYVDTQVATRLTQAAGDARYVNISATTSWGRSFINEANSADARATLAVPPTSRRVIPGVGLTLTSGSDNLGTDINLRLGNPSSITATSENEVSSTSHTHSISEVTIRNLIADGSTGAHGTYAFLGVAGDDPAIQPGSVVAGSRLRYAGMRTYGNAYDRVQTNLGNSPSGSWRAMGLKPDMDASTNGVTATLFMRIS